MTESSTGGIPYRASLGFLGSTVNDFVVLYRRKVFARFLAECSPGANDRVVDLGVSGNNDHPVHYFFETMYPYRENLFAIGRPSENAGWYADRFPGLTYIEADLRAIPRADRFFQVGFCNAVVEHAGSRVEQRALIHEICRTCDRVFVTTPNRLFPIEVHTALPLLHWLPRPWFGAILRTIGLTHLSTEADLNLLTAREFLALFPSTHRARLVIGGMHPFSVSLACVAERV